MGWKALAVGINIPWESLLSLGMKMALTRVNETFFLFHVTRENIIFRPFLPKLLSRAAHHPVKGWLPRETKSFTVYREFIDIIFVRMPVRL
jgi:hypothetical protein